MMNVNEFRKELKGFWAMLGRNQGLKTSIVNFWFSMGLALVVGIPVLAYLMPTPSLWPKILLASSGLVLFVFLTSSPFLIYLGGKKDRLKKEMRELAEHARAIEIIEAMRVAAGQDELDQAIETLGRVGIATACFRFFPALFPDAIWASHVETKVSPDDFAKCLITLISKHEVESPLGNRFAQTQEFYRRVYLFLLDHKENPLSLRTAACLGARVGKKIRDTAFGS